MKDSGACDQEGNANANGMGTDKGHASRKPGRAGKTSITNPRSPAAAPIFDSSEALSSKPPTMKSSMYPRLDLRPKRGGSSEASLDFPGEPDSASETSSYHDVLETTCGDGGHSTRPEPTSLNIPNLHSQTENVHQQMRIPPCTSEEEADALLTATPLPPVTKASLEELDLAWIQSNINLRVDINYDHDLHFLPAAGLNGEEKMRRSNKYWSSLEAELRIMYQHKLLGSCAGCDYQDEERDDSFCTAEPAFFTPRLPQMFNTLKELLIILLPDRDQDQIADHFDIPLLLQEASHGLLDVVRLATWLCELLTDHCAPMRDESAQEVAGLIRQGAEKADLHALVAGIAKLFVFLEAMKLDVANHQIRNFRYHLIDDTVAFQQDFFQAKMKKGRLRVKSSREWYDAAIASHKSCDLVGESRPLAVGSLIHGLIGLCTSPRAAVPETLKYDKTRLKSIRDEIQDILHLDMCLCVFDQLCRSILNGGDPDCNRPPISGVLQSQVPDIRLVLQSRIMDLTEGNMSSNMSVSDIWLEHGRAIALELLRAAFHACHRAETAISEQYVTQTTHQLLVKFRSERRTGVGAGEIASVLEQAAHRHARVFQNMTTLGVSEAQKVWHEHRKQKRSWRSMPDTDDMARTLAHMAVIHWKVWADLVYLAPPEEQGPELEEEHEHEPDQEHGAFGDSIDGDLGDNNSAFQDSL